ncbi:MAG: hypothetical protein V4813_09365 [Gemmatimonadota bacterium]
MPIRRAWPLIAIGAVAATGCLRQFVSAPFGTPLDEACSSFSTLDGARLDTFRLGPAEFAVPKGWSTRRNSAQELQLTRIDAELNVWLGTRFVFPIVPARTSIRCVVARGDTTISIEAVRLPGFTYRVDVEWDPQVDGRFFYMQWQTRYVEHLKQVRAIVERVRFPVDSNRRDRGGDEAGAPAAREQRAGRGTAVSHETKPSAGAT